MLSVPADAMPLLVSATAMPLAVPADAMPLSVPADAMPLPVLAGTMPLAVPVDAMPLSIPADASTATNLNKILKAEDGQQVTNIFLINNEIDRIMSAMRKVGISSEHEQIPGLE